MRKKLNKIAKDTNIFLKNFLKNQGNSKLVPAMKYSLFPGGKKIRSKILIDIGSLFSINYKTLIVIGALSSEWNTFINNLEFLGPSIITLIFTMMMIGYNTPKLFGISKKQSITIAIESGIQNGTIGITIGNIILNQSQGISVLSLPSGVYSILMYAVCLPIICFFIKKK